MSEIAVASPDAPLASRVLAGRFLGGLAGFGVLHTVAAFTVAAVLASSLYLAGVGSDATLLTVAVELVALLVALPLLYRLYGSLLGRLPGVVSERGERGPATGRGLFVSVLGVLRDLRTPTADRLVARFVAEAGEGSSWFLSELSTTGVVVRAVYTGADPLDERPLVVPEDALVVALHAPLASTWLPLRGRTLAAALHAHRTDVALAAADLRSGVPVEWALRRLSVGVAS